MDLKRLVVSHRVSRPGRGGPAGALDRCPSASVDFDPTVPPPADAASAATQGSEEPVTTTDWRSSSYDLLNGVEIRDHSESIPRELFDRLFRK